MKRRNPGPKLVLNATTGQNVTLDSYHSAHYADPKPATDFGSWRVGTHEVDRFDELVVRLGKNQSIHIETMSATSMFVDIAGVCFWLSRVEGVWVLKGPEVREGALTPGFDSGDRRDPERRRVVKLIKSRLAELGERQRAFAAQSRKERR